MFAALVIFGVLWKVPEWQVPAGVTAIEVAELENQFRKTLAQIAAGLVILVGVYYTARRVAAAEGTAEAALKSVEVTQEGQITERFTRAIEQLGAGDNMAICLGGIYALEGIAKDSSKDHWQIMEVLTAYVRDKARWKEGAPEGDGEEANRMPTDIQAILTVLGRRCRGHESDGQGLDLTGTDLRHADLGDAHLEGASLTEAHLEGGRLYGAHLEGAILNRAHLGSAYLHSARLEGAHLDDAHLQGAHLVGTYLERAILDGAHLEGTYLGGAHLEGANLDRANLVGANLLGANLREANLSGVVGLTQAQLDSARSYKGATLPDYLKESKAAGQEDD